MFQRGLKLAIIMWDRKLATKHAVLRQLEDRLSRTASRPRASRYITATCLNGTISKGAETCVSAQPQVLRIHRDLVDFEKVRMFFQQLLEEENQTMAREDKSKAERDNEFWEHCTPDEQDMLRKCAAVRRGVITVITIGQRTQWDKTKASQSDDFMFKGALAIVDELKNMMLKHRQHLEEGDQE